MTAAVSPDGRYLAVVNAGYGTFESRYQQSIAVLDIKTSTVTDFPEPRTATELPQTMYSGLAFGKDGTHLYAVFDSLTAPEGKGKDETGNAIAVYNFSDGKVTPEKLLPVPLQQLAPGKLQNRIGAALPAGFAIPSPAGIAVRKGTAGTDELLVADNLSDDVLLMDGGTGKVLRRFDLSEGKVVPSTYPVSITVNRSGSRAFVALWNGSAVAELDLNKGKVVKKLVLLAPQQATSPSSHPAAFAWSPDERILYVALANRDAVAAVRVGGDGLKLQASMTRGCRGRATSAPCRMRLRFQKTANGSLPPTRAPMRWRCLTSARARQRGRKSAPWVGFRRSGIRRRWRWRAIRSTWRPPRARVRGQIICRRRGFLGHARSGSSTYIATLLHGSIAAIDLAEIEAKREQMTRTVIETNMMKAAQAKIAFRSGTNPIRHVIYIIKENRTYDQILGDLGVGNGMPGLTMYGEEITPNEHKLARQFGVLDNFYDSGEVSGDGHVWSNAAITSDYTEKTWQQSYRGQERVYDYEGVVENGYPLREGISDVNEPGSGYIWSDLARNGKSLYHFGEFISTTFCANPDTGPKASSPTQGTPEPAPAQCGARGDIRHGEALPQNYGGGNSLYPWPIPLIKENVPTKPELVGHFDPKFPDFELSFPDQLRVEEFLTHFRQWVQERGQGQDTMPQFIQLRLPNDHTAGTTPGMPTPKASVADNDLAVGRAVEAIAHSPYWDDTAFFILEDDAQNGADHVDAHRSVVLVVSKYSPRRAKPLVDSTFYTTVSVLRTMEELLDLPPMNNNDAFAPAMAPLFTGAGDQPPFEADYRNRDNGLLYQANGPQAPGAQESSRMDFTHEDRADPRVLNVILWRDAMGNKPLPAMLAHPQKGREQDDDDDK